MTRLRRVPVDERPLDGFLDLVGEERFRHAERAADQARGRLGRRVFWNVNSTAQGGGVAEILRSLLPYLQGLGIDTRWLVLDGTPQFFHVTKRLHHALHGSAGNGDGLGEQERATYEQVLAEAAAELLDMVGPRDIVLLHDPQTAGLAPYLTSQGATVIWRCHIGKDNPNGEVRRGWRFLLPYLADVAMTVFSRGSYIPSWWDAGRRLVIAPSIDPFSAKNRELDDASVRAILVHAGILAGEGDAGCPTFLRQDGSEGRVESRAHVLSLAKPSWTTPLAVQVSRWDHLKDPVGVIYSFAQVASNGLAEEPQLVLAGPSVGTIADDPESAEVFDQVAATWEHLPAPVRERVHIVALPMADIEENAAIVNALQRHATIVLQKSLDEGFGLTVTEAMWKSRPVIASAVGGIQDQIVDGVHGCLLRDPADAAAFSAVLQRLLANAPEARRLGENAHERAREEYLTIRHLTQYAELLSRVAA